MQNCSSDNQSRIKYILVKANKYKLPIYTIHIISKSYCQYNKARVVTQLTQVSKKQQKSGCAKSYVFYSNVLCKRKDGSAGLDSVTN